MYWRIKIFRFEAAENKYVYDKYILMRSGTLFTDAIPYYQQLRAYEDKYPEQLSYRYDDSQDAISENGGVTTQQPFINSIIANTDSTVMRQFRDSYMNHLSHYMSDMVCFNPNDTLRYSYSLFFLWHMNPNPAHVYNDNYKIVFDYNTAENYHAIDDAIVPSSWNGYQKFQGVIRSDTMYLEIVNNQVQWHY